jgi:hypothetical protein
MGRHFLLCLFFLAIGVVAYVEYLEPNMIDAVGTQRLTQIVVQWLDETSIPQDGSLSAADLLTQLSGNFRLESTLENESQGLYEVDGNDIGSGTYNIFLYAVDPDLAVQRVIKIFENGRLRPGIRIGVAQYTNEDRTDWVYRAAYPPELENFEITY